MERTIEVASSHENRRSPKRVLWDLTSAAARRCTIILLLTPWVAASQERADFIVVAKPQHLTVLNRYQQQLSLEDKGMLGGNAPFRFINHSEMLSDGLTRCAKVELEGVPYFLVKDDTGGFAGNTAAGVSRTYRNVAVLSDTIMVVKRGALVLLDATNRTRTPLKESEQLVRVFQSSRLSFVRSLTTGAYGWVDLKDTKGKSWVAVRGVKPNASKSLHEFAPEIQLKLNVVNSKLTGLYKVLNRTASKHFVAPQWMLQSSDSGLQCVLPSDTAAQFYRESTRWLAKEIELLVLGSSLRVTSVPGRIEIR